MIKVTWFVNYDQTLFQHQLLCHGPVSCQNLKESADGHQGQERTGPTVVPSHKGLCKFNISNLSLAHR